MTYGTAFQWRLQAILNGTDCLSADEVKCADGISLLRIAEKEVEEYEDYPEDEDDNKFKFGV